MADSYKNILVSIGENPEREGLLDTPTRAAKAMLTFTQVMSIWISINCDPKFLIFEKMAEKNGQSQTHVVR